ncbi:MAG: acyltransferase [Clostridia bacterium]|nr:acyltransferase [Clostridia bacterium]
MSTENTDISKNGFLLISKYRAVLMGIAAIWIHVYHAWIHTIINPTTGFGIAMSNVENFIALIGNCGVDIFLLMSGMGLTYAIKKDPLPKFYFRRIRRVYLPFLIAGIVSAVLEKWSFATFLSNVSGYSFYAVDVNQYCWFVPAIITFYLFFPLYFMVFEKVKNKTVCTAFVLLVWLLLSLVLKNVMRIDLFALFNRIPIFLIGIFFGHMVQNRKDMVFKAWHYILLSLVFIARLFLLYLYKVKNFSIVLVQEKLVVPNVLFAVSFPFLVAKLMDLIERRLPKTGRVIAKVLGFWGMISLEIYLVYTCFLVTFFTPIVLTIRSFGTPPFVINLAVFAITSLLAWVLYMACMYFWKLVELPFRKKNI